MYAEERQQAIAQLVSDRGRLSVAAIAEQFGVTTETVRRDLSTLERMGLVRRLHGGAVPASSLAVIESGLGERDQANTAQKELIAKAALEELPPPGGMVLVDAGSTTGRFAAMLPRDLRLTVITHAVPIAARLVGFPSVELHLLPGRVRATTQAAVGADTVGALSRLRVDLVLLGTNGITPGHGLSTPDHEEAAAKRAMLQAARRVICLSDSSKFGTETAVRFAALDEIDVLITDSGISDEDRAAVEDAGVEVVIA
ncbi:DeoR/GlpR family DNA-binding transcription regulator [Nocardioides mangrovi]|uniref:Lactose phosphotransferase system repressor n=1 Tax=Nocardioides mangrovi TaxID=2874580 RepID=A0ABS7UJ51_9ACTN|nr:DeoR/GlpR family DNA-binding transcription regulator [Nocardioides mangrovi]MBZ5741064.1 DeoR/GlpR family DNA-binding transcription regulator [Nocardioides mangrovi]